MKAGKTWRKACYCNTLNLRPNAHPVKDMLCLEETMYGLLFFCGSKDLR